MWLGSVMLKKLLSQPTSRHSNLRVMDLYIFMQTYLRTLPLLESLGKRLKMKKILSLRSMSFRNFWQVCFLDFFEIMFISFSLHSSLRICQLVGLSVRQLVFFLVCQSVCLSVCQFVQFVFLSIVSFLISLSLLFSCVLYDSKPSFVHLFVRWLVGRLMLVGPLVTFLAILSFLSSLLLPKCSSDLQYCPW